MEVETLWVSTWKKLISFGIGFDCVDGVNVYIECKNAYSNMTTATQYENMPVETSQTSWIDFVIMVIGTPTGPLTPGGTGPRTPGVPYPLNCTLRTSRNHKNQSGRGKSRYPTWGCGLYKSYGHAVTYLSSRTKFLPVRYPTWDCGLYKSYGHAMK